MQILHRAETIFFWMTLMLAAICCHDKDEMVELVGFIQHLDFAESRIKTSQTFSGFGVTIGCRSKDGKIKTIGSGEVNEEEKFKVFLPQETVRDGLIREECYAQVHSASDSSCPLHNSREALNIIFQYQSKEKNTIRHCGKLNFSPITCTSKFLWPFRKPKLPHILSPQLFEYPPPILTLETPLTPSFPSSNQPISTLSPPKQEDLPPVVSPAYIKPHPYPPVPVLKHPLPISSPKHYPPAFSTPPIRVLKQPPLPRHKDFPPAPASSFDTPASPRPDEPLPLTPSPNGNDDFSSAPAPSFDTPASPVQDEPLPLGPSPNGNEDYSPAPAPSLNIPASPPPDEPLPLGPSPSPLANSIPFPPHIPRFTHVPSFRIPQPPPIPLVNKPFPPAS